MTWVPKNRPENDDDENSCKDDDEKGNFVRNFESQRARNFALRNEHLCGSFFVSSSATTRIVYQTSVGMTRWNFQTNFESFSRSFKRSYKLPFWYQSFFEIEFKIHYKVAYAIFKPSGLKKLSDHHPTSHGKIARKWKLRRFFSAMRNYRALCLYLKLNFQTRPKIKLGFSLAQMAKMSG